MPAFFLSGVLTVFTFLHLVTVFRLSRIYLRTAVFFHVIVDPEAKAASLKESWLASILICFKPHLWIAMGLTFVTTVLAIASPLYVMAIYDRYYLFGVFGDAWVACPCHGCSFGGRSLFRTLRTRLLARVGSRIDVLVGKAVFERLLYLPSGVTEGASVGAQISRIKDFDTVREFLTGQSAQSALDVPFSVLIIASVYVLAGWIGLVPTLGPWRWWHLEFWLVTPCGFQVAEAARAGSSRQDLAIEV